MHRTEAHLGVSASTLKCHAELINGTWQGTIVMLGVTNWQTLRTTVHSAHSATPQQKRLTSTETVDIITAVRWVEPVHPFPERQP